MEKDGEQPHTRVALFLGAGASQFAGYRTFQSFPDLLFGSAIGQSPDRPAEEREVEALFRNIEQVIHADDKWPTHDNFMWKLAGYGALLENLKKDSELRSRFAKLTGQMSRLTDFERTLKTARLALIDATIAHYSQKTVDQAKQDARSDARKHYRQFRQVYNLYAAIAALNNADTLYLPIFTTNYDLLLEDMFWEFSSTILDAESALSTGVTDRTQIVVASFLHTLCCHVDKGYNAEEVENLCFEAGMDYDNLRGTVKREKIWSLIKECASASRLPHLVSIVEMQRGSLGYGVPSVLLEPCAPPIDVWLGSVSVPYFPLVNGFCLSAEETPWSAAWYEQIRPSRGAHLYRLHGCVCWFWHDYGNECVYFHRERLPEGYVDKLCTMFPGHEKFPGKNPHAFAFQRFYRTLIDCEVVLFIGSSFRDDNVMHLLLAANAQRAKPLRVLMVDQNLNQALVIEKLRQSSMISPFPARVPSAEAGEVQGMSIDFGRDSGFDKAILNKLNMLL